MAKDNARYPLRRMKVGVVADNDLDTRFRFIRGRVWYSQARYSKTLDNVRISRIQTGRTPEDGMHQINRYVEPETWVEVEMSEAATIQLEGSNEL